MRSNHTESAYDYCQGPMEPPVDQNYDDCEEEGYQCIGQDTESNIYDDVKPETTLRTRDDVASISNCYESIYSGGDRLMTPDGRAILDNSTMRMGGSSSASSSIGNRSCCEQSNSLYGVGGSRFDSASVSQSSTGNYRLLTEHRTGVQHDLLRMDIHVCLTISGLDFNLNVISSPYRAVNTLRLDYTNQSVNAI